MFRNTGCSSQSSNLFSHAILFGAFLFAVAILPASAQEKPKIRTITAFIRLDTEPIHSSRSRIP